jgi:hypothetical protein
LNFVDVGKAATTERVLQEKAFLVENARGVSELLVGERGLHDIIQGFTNVATGKGRIGR